MASGEISYENDPFWGNLTPNQQKQMVFQALLARFGSRRALIEELDRIKRLSLLKPVGGHVKEEGTRTVGMQNRPNPQWREIQTPSLLISGARIPEPTHLLSVQPTPHAAISEFHRVCRGCSCELDENTPDCRTCKMRHYARSKNRRQNG